MKLMLPTLTISAALMASSAFAGDMGLAQSLLNYQHQWAHINYELPDAQKSDAFAALAKAEESLVQQYPDRAEPLVWQGIILSSQAGAEGGFSALGLAKDARNQLLAAEKINPTALSGSIDTSLGTLYFKVPGWPLGFGDDDKAETYLKEALKINPKGIDPNYFYGEFLYGKGKYQAAMQALETAQAAAPRPDRPLADKGRHQEIQALISKIRSEHSDALVAKKS